MIKNRPAAKNQSNSITFNHAKSAKCRGAKAAEQEERMALMINRQQELLEELELWQI